MSLILSPQHIAAICAASLQGEEYRILSGRLGKPKLSARQCERLVAAGYLKRVRRLPPDFPYYILTPAGREKQLELLAKKRNST